MTMSRLRNYEFHTKGVVVVVVVNRLYFLESIVESGCIGFRRKITLGVPEVRQ